MYRILRVLKAGVNRQRGKRRVRRGPCVGEGLLAQPGCRKTAKKTKDKAFARSVNRQDIINGAQELGVPLDDHVAFCVKAMQARAAALGLAGNAATQSELRP